MAKQTDNAAKRRRQWAAADAAQRRAMIVDAALHLLHRHGAEAVTIRRVAHRLGVGAMTLYTYVDGLEGLRLAMMQRGFDMLRQACNQASIRAAARPLWGGARQYVQFATDHPSLYHLMFSFPNINHQPTQVAFHQEFEKTLDEMRDIVPADQNLGHMDDAQLRRFTGRVWIAMHGLASLAIAGRLGVLGADLDQILEDMLSRLTPTPPTEDDPPGSPRL